MARKHYLGDCTEKNETSDQSGTKTCLVQDIPMLLSYHNDEWISQKKMYVCENIWVIVTTGMNISKKKNEGPEEEVCVKESFKTKPEKSRLM